MEWGGRGKEGKGRGAKTVSLIKISSVEEGES